jgi:hypothetical protein
VIVFPAANYARDLAFLDPGCRGTKLDADAGDDSATP